MLRLMPDDEMRQIFVRIVFKLGFQFINLMCSTYLTHNLRNLQVRKLMYKKKCIIMLTHGNLQGTNYLIFCWVQSSNYKDRVFLLEFIYILSRKCIESDIV